MKDDKVMCIWCKENTGDATDIYQISVQDPTPAPPFDDPKMASGDGPERREGPIVLPGMLEPDRGIPKHFGSEKQLHSGTGYNIVIDAEGQVYGTREPYNSEAVLQFNSRAIGEVQIKGKRSNLYLAMNEKGKVYAESDKESENTWFKETYEHGWNRYMWLGNNKDWFLGIKKSGEMKKGHRTKKGQNAVKFVPRAAEAPNN